MLSSRFRLPLGLLFLIALTFTLGSRRYTPQPRLSRSAARAAVAQLPLYFEAIQTGSGNESTFAARGPGYSLWLRPTGTDFELTRTAPPAAEGADHRTRNSASSRSAVLRTRLVGANAHPKLRGVKPLPGKTNYLLGNDSRKWRTDCPTYARVQYEAVYPGVDLVYYGHQGELEYDFIVQPGADPGCIRFRAEGTEPPAIQPNGDLLLRVDGQVIRQRKPVVYQEEAGHRREIPGAYQLAANGEVGFQIGAYDRARPLIIDPVVAFSTYLGGSGTDGLMDVALDADGNIYATGWTLSADFPVSAGAPQTKFAGGGLNDAVVFKLNSTGTALVYATYLGGKFLFKNPTTQLTYGDDAGTSLAVDGQGNASVVGYTSSTDFPVKNAFQPTMSTSGGLADNYEGFVAKLNAAGNGLVFSTYIGSPAGYDEAHGVAVDGSGNIYVAGETAGTGFPVTPGAYNTGPVGSAGFVTKLTPQGALIYSTFLASNGWPSAIAVDTAGYAYLAGTTVSNVFPTTPNAYQRTSGGDTEAFVAKLSQDGSALIYSTYLGGSGKDIAYNLALDAAGNAYVTGDTRSSNFPLVNPVQSVYRGGDRDAFVTEVNADGSALVFSTYLGGALFDRGRGIAVASNGNIWVSGATDSTDFVTTPDALQPQNAGMRDVFLTELAPGGGSILYSTYLGGSDNDGGAGTATNGPTVALDRSGGLVVGSVTHSTNFPLQNPLQSTLSGPYDCLITRLHWNAPSAPTDLQAAPASPTEVALSWTDTSDNENGFKIQRRSGAGDFQQIAATGANIRSYRDAGLTPETTYTYRLVAYNAVGDSTPSAEAAGTTPRIPPAAPSGLTATVGGSRAVSLSWTDNSADEDGFAIERAAGAGSFSAVGAVGANVATYADTTAQPSTTYTYRVRSVAGGSGSAYAVSAPVTTPPDPPAAPTNLAVADIADAQVTLSWTASAGATSYTVKRSLSVSGPFAPVGTSASVGYTDASVSNASTYYYVVTAVNAGGESPASNTTSAVRPGYTISGQVTVGGMGLASALVIGAGQTVTTGPNGDYTLAGVHSGYYLVQAFATGYTFADQTVGVGPSKGGVDFAAPANPGLDGTYTISGTVTVGGSGFGGALVIGAGQTVTTAADGSYTLTGVHSGYYLVQAFATGYTFADQTVGVGPSKSGVDFAAPANPAVSGTFTITGQVTVGGAGLAGALVIGAGQTVVTGPNGDYTLTGVHSGYYLVQAYAIGYTFADLTVFVGPDKSGVDFSAPANPALGGTFTISGTVTVGGVALGGAVVYGAGQSVITAPDGSYTLTGVHSGYFLVQAFAAGYTFADQTVLVGPSKNGVDFAAP